MGRTLSETDWWAPLDDPLDRYRRATCEHVAAAASVGRMTDLRARALAELHVDGWSFARIAGAVGLTRSRVQQLVERGRGVVP